MLIKLLCIVVQVIFCFAATLICVSYACIVHIFVCRHLFRMTKLTWRMYFVYFNFLSVYTSYFHAKLVTCQQRQYNMYILSMIYSESSDCLLNLVLNKNIKMMLPSFLSSGCREHFSLIINALFLMIFHSSSNSNADYQVNSWIYFQS